MGWDRKCEAWDIRNAISGSFARERTRREKWERARGKEEEPVSQMMERGTAW